MEDFETELRNVISCRLANKRYRVAYEFVACTDYLPFTVEQTVSAFSNTSGGVLVFGLDAADGCAPVAGFDADAVREQLMDLCANQMTPAAHLEAVVLSHEGAPVLFARIREVIPREKPCYITKFGVHGGAYVRTGSKNRDLTSLESAYFEDNKAQPRDDIAVVPDAGPADLDRSLVDALTRRCRELHPRMFGPIPDEGILLELHVLAKYIGKLRATVAGLVALGKNPQSHFPRLTVRFTAYEGNDTGWGSKVEPYFSTKIVGPAPVLVEDTLAAVAAASREEGEYPGAAYPEAALRELLCNAVMHRDYNARAQASHILVNLYDSSLEVVSPGGIYGLVNADGLASPEVSFTRNQFLADILEAVPYESGPFMAPSRGAGLMLVKRELAQAGGLSLELSDEITQFRARIVQTGGEKAAKAVKSRKAAPVLEALRGLGEATPAQLQEATGMNRRTLGYHLKNLVAQGAIVREGSVHSPTQTYRLA